MAAQRHTKSISPEMVRDQLLARQVAGSRYIFPNLSPAPGGKWMLALAGREECASDYVVNRTAYPFHVVEYVAEGRGVVRFGAGEEQNVAAGSVYCYAPNTPLVLRTDPAAPMVKFFFALSGREVSRRLAAVRLMPGTVRKFGAPAEVLSIAEDVIREGQRHGKHAPAICLKLVELLLLKVADATGEAGGGDDRARENFLRCKAAIEAHASELRSLDEIAAAVRLDGASVCRLFRRFQGTSPYQYLLRRKMTLAAEYLIERGGLVKEAAERVGFADPYHFARCFKLVHGVTPSEVRRYRTSFANKERSGGESPEFGYTAPS